MKHIIESLNEITLNAAVKITTYGLAILLVCLSIYAAYLNGRGMGR